MCPQSLKSMHGTQSHEHAEAPAAALDSVGLSVPDARQLLHYHLPSSHEAGGLSCSVFIWGPSWPCGQWHSSDTVLHGRWTDGWQLDISEYLKPSEEWRRWILDVLSQSGTWMRYKIAVRITPS